MISVNMIYDLGYTGRYEPFVELTDLLKDLSIELLNNSDRVVDLPIVQSHILRGLESDGDPRLRGPMIINERADQETVMPSNRSVLRRPTTLAWIKECCFRDPALYNYPLVFGYYHFNFLRHDPIKYPSVEYTTLLNEADISKIHLPFSVAAYSRFSSLRRRLSPEPHERDIDAFMFGTTRYGAEILQDHRGDGARAMGRLTTRNTLLAIGHFLRDADMDNVLFRSKIVVSPYGLCMSSYKDWQALYAGCVLIKPDSSEQVNYLPDLFKDNEWYVPCANDFSDLEEKVQMVLDRYDYYYEKAQIARSALMESTNLERRTSDFYHFIMKTLDKIPASNVRRYEEIEPETYHKKDMRLARVMVQAFSAPPREGPNLYGDTAELNHPSWIKVRGSLSVAPISGPGGMSAWKLIEDTSQTTHDLRRNIPKETRSEPYSFSFVAKAEERSDILVWLAGADHNNRVAIGVDIFRGEVWDIQTLGKGWSDVRAGTINLGDGWWWCWFSAISDESDSIGVLVTLDTHMRLGGYDGDGQSGAWFGGLRLEHGPIATFILPTVANDNPARSDGAASPAAEPARRGRNLFAPAEDLTNQAWSIVRSALAAEPGQAPGGFPAWKLVEDTSSTTHDFRRNLAKEPRSERYCLSFIAKAAERSNIHVWLLGRSQGDRAQVTIDLASGQIHEQRSFGEGWTNLGAGIVALEDGWYWCWMSASSDEAATIGVLVTMDTQERRGGYDGDGRSGIWFGGLRLEEGSTPTFALPTVALPEKTTPPSLADEFKRYFTVGPSRHMLGFHGDFYLLSEAYHLLRQATLFIETGTSGAATTCQAARGFPDIECYTCELNENNYISSSRNTKAYPNITIENKPSPQFLYELLGSSPQLADRKTVFWLDAHGNDFPCPLADEVGFITRTFDKAAILIDDFQVPDRPEFGFDRYRDGTALVWDYVEPRLAPGRQYKILRPCYKWKTSLHDPLRGWLLIAMGDWDLFPAELETNYELTRFTPEAAG